MRHTYRTALAVFITLVAAPAAAQPIGNKAADDGLTILQSNGVEHVAYKFRDVNRADSLMTGLAVTAFWSGGASSLLLWGQTGAGTWGIAGPALTLSLEPKSDYWLLHNTAATALERMVIAGTTGDIVFDRTFGWAAGTPGSHGGTDFDFRRSTGAAAWQTTVSYTNVVRRIGQLAVGDLFETLDITFGSGGVASGAEVVFDADWDHVATSVSSPPLTKYPAGGAAEMAAAEVAATTTAPEPASWALLATGLVALGAVARRRRTA